MRVGGPLRFKRKVLECESGMDASLHGRFSRGLWRVNNFGKTDGGDRAPARPARRYYCTNLSQTQSISPWPSTEPPGFGKRFGA